MARLALRGDVVDDRAHFRAHFRETGTSGLYEWDVHWAPAGHALAADAIARALAALALVPKSTPTAAAPADRILPVR